MTDSQIADPNRQALVAAAVAEFSERGYDGARVQEMARRAGLTTGAIYNRFTGKADLLLEAVRTLSDTELDSLFAVERTSAELLVLLGKTLVAAGPSSRSQLLHEAFAAARRNPEVATLLRRQLDEQSGRPWDLVEAAVEEGSIDSDIDRLALVRFCQALGLGFLLLDAVGAARPDPVAWERLIGRIVAGLSPE